MVEHKWGMFLELMRWVEGGSCRHDAILRYFGDEAETLAGCGRCDVCRALEADGEAGDPERVDADRAQGALGGGARARPLRAAGRGQAAARRSDERLERAGLDSRARPSARWRSIQRGAGCCALLRRCVIGGLGRASPADERPVVVLTESGRAVMKGRAPGAPAAAPLSRRAAGPGAGRAGETGRRRRRAGARGGRRSTRAARRSSKRCAPPARGGARGGHAAVHRGERPQPARHRAAAAARRWRELQEAHGIGPSKAERYGAGFLRIIAEESGKAGPG